DLAKIRRADLLSHLDDELGVEAELAAAGVAHRAECSHVDTVLALVVGGAAAVEARARNRGAPGIAALAPLAFHAVDDIAMAVDQQGRRRLALVVFGEQERRLAA